MSNQSPAVFNFVSNSLRVVMRDGDPWFVAADVCAALGISRTDDGVSRLDDDEKGADSIRTPGGDQEMTIINESGLYSLILGSRKPEAKKFKKWVTSEVLPAIRKTGRYVAPQATPQPPPPSTAHEQLNAADMRNLTRLVWLMSHRLHFESAWVQAIWKALRNATGTPAPNRFEVRHLPILATEVRRIWNIAEAMAEAEANAEREVMKRILRQGQDANKVMSEMQAQLTQATTENREQANSWLARWGESEIVDLLERKPVCGAVYPEAQELQRG